jgi:hypothetical protein
MTTQAENLESFDGLAASSEEHEAIDQALSSLRPGDKPAASGDFDDFVLPDPPGMAASSDGGMFNQADIDALFGGDSASAPARKIGLKAVIESDVVSCRCSKWSATAWCAPSPPRCAT